MTKADKKLLIIILLAALLGVVANYAYAAIQQAKATDIKAVIKVEGKIVETIALNKKGEAASFTVAGKLGPETVEVAAGKIRIVEAPCPEQICVKQGWISRPGQSVVCVPGRVAIYIEGDSPVDAIVR